MLPHRGGLILVSAVAGVTAQLLALAASMIAIALVGDLVEGGVYGLPFLFLGLALGIPALIMGQTDLRALRVGAMDPSGQRRTRTGVRLAMAGTLLGLVQLVALLGLAFWEQLSV